MDAIALHRTTILRPFTQFLAEIGAPINGILRQVKLPILALDDPDYYISSVAFWAFVEQMALKEAIPELGFLVGKHFGANAVAPNYSRVLTKTTTLYHALLKTRQAVKADISRSDILIYCTDSGYTRFCHQTSFGINHPNHQRMEWFALMAMLGIIQEFTGTHWRPKVIGLMSYQKPSNKIREYLPNCLFRTGQTYGYISIETPLLSRPPLQNQKQPVTDSAAKMDTSPLGEPVDDIIGSLKQVLQGYLLEGTPKIDLAAEMAHTSVRTLQREFAKSGLSYLDLLAQARLETASRLLKENKLQVQEIAYKLGYDDASHFSRAFRRSSGMSPSEYRKSIMANPSQYY